MRNGLSILARIGIATLLLVAAGAQATTYKWKDPKTGRIVISDSPPPAGIKEIGTRPNRSGGATDPANLPLATRKAMAEFPVTLFTADNCLEACADARGLLNRRGVPFTEANIGDPASRQRLEAYGEPKLPSLLVGQQLTRGFQNTQWNEVLGLAGYPATAPVGYRPPPPPPPPEPQDTEPQGTEPQDTATNAGDTEANQEQ